MLKKSNDNMGKAGSLHKLPAFPYGSKMRVDVRKHSVFLDAYIQ